MRSTRIWFFVRLVLALALGLACPIFFIISPEGTFTPPRYWSVAHALGQFVPSDFSGPNAVGALVMGPLFVTQYAAYVVVIMIAFKLCALAYRRFAR